MLFHRKNFKHGNSILSNQELPYATITQEECYFFTDAEIDAASLTDRSDYEIEETEGADVQKDKSDGDDVKVESIADEPALNASSTVSLNNEHLLT